MPLVVEGVGLLMSSVAIRGGATPSSVGVPRSRLEIGLVNNMPDGALQATERQFARWLATVSGTRDVRLHLFSLNEVTRGRGRSPLSRRPLRRPPSSRECASRRVDRHRGRTGRGSADGRALLAGTDAGHRLGRAQYRIGRSSPVSQPTPPFSTSTASTGAGSRRSASGFSNPSRCRLMACSPADLARIRMPHSRWNDLAEGELRSHGYAITSRSEEVGIDIFTKRWASLFVYLQGHPEYDGDTLAREFRRDLRWFLEGGRQNAPFLPTEYFDYRVRRRDGRV